MGRKTIIVIFSILFVGILGITIFIHFAKGNFQSSEDIIVPLEAVEPAESSDLALEFSGYIDVNTHFYNEKYVISDLGDAEMIIISPPPFTDEQQHGVYDSDEMIDFASEKVFVSGGGGDLNTMIQRYSDSDVISESVVQEFIALAENLIDTGIVAFGEIAALHLSLGETHPFEEVLPNHPLFFVLADIAADSELPILLHMEAVDESVQTPERLTQNSSANPNLLQSNITALEELLDYNVDAKIVWLQAGWDHTGDRTLELMANLLNDHPNLFLGLKAGSDSVSETSPLDEEGSLKDEWKVFLTKFSDRCVVASDNFYGGVGESGTRQDAVMTILNGLEFEVAQKIGYKNAIKLFKLQ